MSREDVLIHLQIMHTWATFALEKKQNFFTSNHMKNIAQWTEDALALLKEQEEETTTFVYDECTLPTCEKCGFHPFVGYIPTIKWMKERGYMKCPRCGRTVNWDGAKGNGL